MGVGDSVLGCCSREGEAAREDDIEEALCCSGKALLDHQGPVAVRVPDGVTFIADRAFCDCKALHSIVFPRTLTSIGESAFRGCSSLTTVTVPGAVTTIGSGAFSGCLSLISVTLPRALDAIRDETFSGCRLLTYVQTPQMLKSIGNWAFFGCANLARVDMPPSLESIGRCAFYSCSSIASVDVPRPVKSIQRGTFAFCSSLRDLRLPDSIDCIGAWAFRDCSSLVALSIPASVTCIGHQSFAWCSSLRSVQLPPSVTSIGVGAFAACVSLSSVSIPESVNSIGDGAFVWCVALSYVHIPSSVDSIGDDAFFGCSTRCAVSVPDSVSRVGQRAFPPNASLTTRNCGGVRRASPLRRAARRSRSPMRAPLLDREASGGSTSRETPSAMGTGCSGVSCSTACTEADLAKYGARDEEPARLLESAARELRRSGAPEERVFDFSAKALEHLKKEALQESPSAMMRCSLREEKARCAQAVKKSEEFRREMEVARMMRADFEEQHLRHMQEVRALEGERELLQRQLDEQGEGRGIHAYPTSVPASPRVPTRHHASAPATPANARCHNLRRNSRGILLAPPVYVRPPVVGVFVQPTAVR